MIRENPNEFDCIPLSAYGRKLKRKTVNPTYRVWRGIGKGGMLTIALFIADKSICDSN